MNTKEQYIWKDGRYIKISSQDTNSNIIVSNGSAKQIQLSVQRKTWWMDNDEDFVTKIFLYIHLINFDSSDIGKCVFLYRKSIQSLRRCTDDENILHYYQGKERYKHPADRYSNYLNIQPTTSISYMGYFVISGQDSGISGYHYPKISDLPINLPRYGTIQTEWVLTKEDIDKGYIEINVSESWTPLIMPNKNSYENYEPSEIMFWNKILGTRNDLGNYHRSLSIKFGLVNLEGGSECMSQDTVKFGRISDSKGCLKFLSEPDIHNKSNVVLDKSNIYMHIK